MRNNYIKIKMNHMNELRATASFNLCNMKFIDVDIKIDTGCPYTSIPIIKLGVPKDEANKLKQQDCSDNKVKKNISFGVNDSEEKRTKDREKFINKEYMDLSSITFKHQLQAFIINEINLGNYIVSVSYNRTGNILLGMDILKDWDIHIGTIDTGETIFLGCPKDQLNEDYLTELEKDFGMAAKINAMRK